MKKIYEAPKMSVETVCAEELLLTTSFAIDNSDKKVESLDQALTKDRDDSDWGGLW